MIRLKIKVLIIFAIVSTYSSVAISELKFTSIEDVKKSIKTIQKYHVKIKSQIYNPMFYNEGNKVPEKFKSPITAKSFVYGESGKKMKIITTMGSKAIGSDMEVMMIFDGKWLWVQQKVKKHPQLESKDPFISAIKISIEKVSPDPVKKPFNTLYGINGIGLIRYKDLPGTFFNLIEKYSLRLNKNKSNKEKIIFSGTIKKSDEILEGEIEKRLNNLIANSTKFCELSIDKNTGLVKSYYIGIAENKPTLVAKFEYLSVNKKLPDNTFLYNPPKGVVVNDITKQILKNLMKK